MSPLKFTLVSVFIAGTLLCHGQSGVKFVNKKNGKEKMISPGQRIVLFPKPPPYIFYPPVKGKLVSVENDVLLVRNGLSKKEHQIKLDDVHMAGFQTPLTITTGVFFNLLGGTFPFWPGSTYALKQVKGKRWELVVE